jgi:hypothetical protein
LAEADEALVDDSLDGFCIRGFRGGVVGREAEGPGGKARYEAEGRRLRPACEPCAGSSPPSVSDEADEATETTLCNRDLVAAVGAGS